jgi:hypothetical protein
LSLTTAKVLEVINKNLSPQQIERSLIYWNARVLEEGEQVKAGPQTFPMPFEGIIVFVDLAPRANWAHPCLYILVDSKTLKTEIVESSFPPIMDKPKEEYHLILQYGKKQTTEKQAS